MKARKLYERAKNQPNNLRFGLLCALLKAVGYVFDHQTGSHVFYEHPVLRDTVNIQSRGGKAIPYQVRQVLDKIEDLGLLEE